MDVSAQDAFEFCRPLRAPKPQRLFFALMLDEASCERLTRFAEEFVHEQGLTATLIKPGRMHIALHRIQARKRNPGGLLFGAKLAGQAVSAAGLTLSFDAIGRVGRNGLGLTSTDKTLAHVLDSLGAALAQNGLRATAPKTPALIAAEGRKIPKLSVMTPLKLTVTGLALIRDDGFHVLRRWPLNRALRQD